MRALSINFKITAKEVKDMAKYLSLWRVNPMAWPTDPAEAVKLLEMLFAATDNLIGAGVVKEHGWFLDGASGYAIMETESTEALRVAQMFDPFLEQVKVEEIVPYETGKEITRGVWKAKVEAMKK